MIRHQDIFYIEAEESEVIEIFRSTSSVSIDLEGLPAAAVAGYICVLKKNGAFRVYVGLHLKNARRSIVYSVDQEKEKETGFSQALNIACGLTETLGLQMQAVNLSFSPALREVLLREIPVLMSPKAAQKAVKEKAEALNDLARMANIEEEELSEETDDSPRSLAKLSALKHATTARLAAAQSAAKKLAEEELHQAQQAALGHSLAALVDNLNTHQTMISVHEGKKQTDAPMERSGTRTGKKAGQAKETETISDSREEQDSPPVVSNAANPKTAAAQTGRIEQNPLPFSAQTETADSQLSTVDVEDANRNPIESDSGEKEAEINPELSISVERGRPVALEKELKMTRRALEVATEKLEETEKDFRLAEERQKLAEATIRQLEQRLAQNESEYRQHQDRLAEAEQRLIERQEQLEESLAEKERLAREKAATEEQIAGLTRELEAAREVEPVVEIVESEETRQLLEQSQAELAQLRKQLEEARAENARLEVEASGQRQKDDADRRRQAAAAAGEGPADFPTGKVAELEEALQQAEARAEFFRREMIRMAISGDVKAGGFQTQAEESRAALPPAEQPPTEKKQPSPRSLRRPPAPGAFFHVDWEMLNIPCSSAEELREAHHSINMVQLNLEGYPSQYCSAFVVVLERNGKKEVFMPFRLSSSNELLVYVPAKQPEKKSDFERTLKEAHKFLKTVGMETEPIDLKEAPGQIPPELSSILVG